MDTALIGLIGLLLGILINETLRRRNRIESYATRVFEKRLEIHEELYARISAAGEIASDVIDNPKYSSKERHKIVSAVVAIAGLLIALLLGRSWLESLGVGLIGGIAVLVAASLVFRQMTNAESSPK